MSLKIYASYIIDMIYKPVYSLEKVARQFGKDA